MAPEVASAPTASLPFPQVVDDALVIKAGRSLARAARSPARVIVFGSRARGDAHPESDIDFLVIERELGSRREERLSLRRSLSGIGVPVDLLVVSEDHVVEWGSVPGTALYEALREGLLVAES